MSFGGTVAVRWTRVISGARAAFRAAGGSPAESSPGLRSGPSAWAWGARPGCPDGSPPCLPAGPCLSSGLRETLGSVCVCCPLRSSQPSYKRQRQIHVSVKARVNGRHCTKIVSSMSARSTELLLRTLKIKRKVHLTKNDEGNSLRTLHTFKKLLEKQSTILTSHQTNRCKLCNRQCLFRPLKSFHSHRKATNEPCFLVLPSLIELKIKFFNKKQQMKRRICKA